MKGKILLGSILILFGLLLLLDSLNIFDFNLGNLLSTWWPLIIVYFGVKELVKPYKSNILGASIVVLIGVLLQANELDVLRTGFWNTFWPLLLILIGVYVILGRKNSHFLKYKKQQKSESFSTEDYTQSYSDAEAGFVFNGNDNPSKLKITAVFGGADKRINAVQFSGGTVEAIFGGVKLDLREAILEKDNMLNLNAAFGGIEIFVPTSWQINSHGSPVFGSLEDKTRYIPSENQTEKQVLNLECNIAFGGIVIRN